MEQRSMCQPWSAGCGCLEHHGQRGPDSESGPNGKRQVCLVGNVFMDTAGQVEAQVTQVP